MPIDKSREYSEQVMDSLIKPALLEEIMKTQGVIIGVLNKKLDERKLYLDLDGGENEYDNGKDELKRE
jgi:hypothetical protein